MQKYNIPIIALAVFSIVILLAQNNIEKAFAIVVHDVTTGALSRLVYSPDRDAFIGIDGGTDSTVRSISATSFTSSDATLTGVNVVELGCNSAGCYSINGTSTVIKYNPSTGGIIQQNTFSMSSGETADLTSIDTSSPRTIVTSSSIFAMAVCDSAVVIYLVISTSDVSVITGRIGDCSGTGLTASTVVGQFISGTQIAFSSSGIGADRFEIWNTGGGRVCISANLGNLFGATGGTITKIGSSWYVTTASSGRVDIFNSSCVDTGDITTAQHGQSTLHNIIDSSVRDELYIQGPSTVTVMNRSAVTSQLYTFSCVSDTARVSSAFASEFQIYACNNGSTTRLVELGIPLEEEEEEGNQQDGFCGVGTLRDCLGDRDALSGLVPANQNITSIGTTIGQGIGIIDPNNENPRTNGVGLFYMLITGSFFAIALMTTVHTLNMRGFISASVKEIDPIFWLFLVVGTVSVAWYLDWIDDIIFAAMTVGLAGLVAFGVLKHFGRI